MQLSTRSFRYRETSPAAKLGCPRVDRSNLPDRPDARSSLQLQHNLGGGAGRVDQPSTGSLHRASFPQAQEQEKLLPESTPPCQLDLEEGTGQTSLAATNLPWRQASGGKSSQTIQEVPPPTQLDSDKLELAILFQLGEKIAKLQQAVDSLAELLDSQQRNHSLNAKLGEACAKHIASNNNNNNNNNTTDNNNNNNNNTHNTNHNHNNNNNSDNNNKDSRESSLDSLDLDNEDPESEPDLDTTSLVSFNPEVGSESSSWSLDHEEADLSLTNLGHKTMAIGLSLGSLIQQQQDEQEGQSIGTAWEPSLECDKESFERTKPKKKVSFGTATFAAYNDKQQNSGQQQRSLKLEQLEHKKQNNNRENSCKNSLGKHSQLHNKRCKTTLACGNHVPQEHPKQKAWQDEPSTMQQQPATASREEDELRPDTNNSLTREEVSLGSLEAEPQATKLAYRSPKHNNNTSSLGIGTKNKAAYGILIDTGAAISLAPRSFAQDVELSPIESTLQLRTVTGQAIEAFGRRTVQLVGPNLSFQVSFVIANVQHALLGLDALMINQLSLIRNNFNEYYLVNTAGATTQLHTRGHLLYIEACPREFGFSNCRGSSFPKRMEAYSMTRVELKKWQSQLQGELVTIASTWKTLGNNKIRTQQL